MKSIEFHDEENAGTIRSKLAGFQKEMFSNFKVLTDLIVEDEFDYIKTTIQSKHGNKYSVLIQKNKDGWIVFPDKADIAVLEEFQLNFPIWRKLYSDYKAKERT